MAGNLFADIEFISNRLNALALLVYFLIKNDLTEK